MVIRSAVGALCVVAVLGAVAVALPERKSSTPVSDKKDPPFGILTKTDFVSPHENAGVPASTTAAEATKLLKLAAVSGAQSRSVEKASAAKPLVQPAPVSVADATPTGPAPTLQAPALAGAAKHTSQLIASADPETPAAAVGVPASPVPPVSHGKEKPGVVDINRASEDTLDHLPGGGRIGHTIVRHRPYRKIEDLVQKRVLRLTAFQRIQGMIKVD